jgi:hypothetical protein
MQTSNDEQFEQYLRQFEPRPPRQLLVAAHPAGWSWRAPLAIAALVVLSLGVVLWTAGHLGPPIQPSWNQQAVTSVSSQVTLGRLNRLMRDDPSQFDAQLTAASRNLLPDVQRREGTLRLLARE